MALCSPVISTLLTISAMVTAPGEPVGEKAGIGILNKVSSLFASYLFKECTKLGLKCFHDLIIFVAAGVPRIMVSAAGSSCLRVAS